MQIIQKNIIYSIRSVVFDFQEEKKYIQFSTEQIKIAENFHNWQRVGYEQTYHNEPEYCYPATLDEIEKKGWNLVQANTSSSAIVMNRLTSTQI